LKLRIATDKRAGFSSGAFFSSGRLARPATNSISLLSFIQSAQPTQNERPVSACLEAGQKSQSLNNRRAFDSNTIKKGIGNCV
jgi:hypothetical protein